MPVVLVACGGAHTMALTGGGCVWTCGINDCGQLGHGDRTGKHLFTRVDPGHFGRARIVMAACGYEHSVVASAAGDVFTWESGESGRLGYNDEKKRLAPARHGREQFGGGKIVFVAAGGYHTPGVITRCRFLRAGCCGCGVVESIASWGWATETSGWCRRGWGRGRCLAGHSCAWRLRVR